VSNSESEFLFIDMLEFLGEFETQVSECINPELHGTDALADLDSVADGNAVTNTDERPLSTPKRDN